MRFLIILAGERLLALIQGYNLLLFSRHHSAPQGSLSPFRRVRQIGVGSPSASPGPSEALLGSNTSAGTWCKIPWINLRGFWLEQAGFQIGTAYTIQAYDGKLVFTAEK